MFVLIILASCRENKSQLDSGSNDHLVNSFGKVKFDTTSFTQMKCGLYINEAGLIAYKTIDNSLKFSEKAIDIFLTTVYKQHTDSSSNNIVLLADIIDTTTVTMEPNGDFSDYKYVYDFAPMMDGGTITAYQKNINN